MKSTSFRSLFLSILSLTLTAMPQAKAQTANPDYPEANWNTSTPEAEQIDSAKLQPWIDYTFTESKERKTDALLLIRHGKIVYEKYNYGYTENMRHLSWSMAKSFSSIVFGIAESEGIISRNEKMVEFYPYHAATAEEQAKRDNITFLNLLTMSSGIDWNESYSTAAPLQSDVAQMLYMNAHKDQAAYVANRPMAYEPGQQFLYSTGSINVAMAGLKYKLPRKQYDVYPWAKLFDKIGMKNVVWEKDDSGTFLGGSYVYATARDYARFGYLLLNDGKWKDEQIVPTGWMKFFKKLSPGLATGDVKPVGDLTETYGAGFWLNTPAPKWNIPTPFPFAPADTFLAIGHTGQSIVMIPSLDLVVVRLAHDGVDSGIDRGEYLKLLLASVDAKKETHFSLMMNDPFHQKTSHRSNANHFTTEKKIPVPAKKQTSVIHLTKLIASVRAKDFCSCHFVVGQTVAFCRELVLNGFPLIRMSVNEVEKRDTFGILPAESASLTSDNFGCSFR